MKHLVTNKQPSSLIPAILTSMILSLASTAALTSLPAADELPPLFPFLISYDGPDNASSMAHLLEAPAGKNGFIRVENGRFADNKGPVRLHATNLTGPANFPTREAADKLAARLARFGINCVRLHYFDAQYGNFMTGKQTGIFGNDDTLSEAFSAAPKAPLHFAPEPVDRQDYLIAALKKRGIYVNVNLHVARFPKGISFFDPSVLDSEKEYAKKLLTHVNPYTGLAYTDDPCVAVIEINNENALFNNYHGGGIDRLPDPYAAELRKQWNAWLSSKYKSTEDMMKSWKWVAAPLCDEQIPEGSFDQPVDIDGKKWILSKGSAETDCHVNKGRLVLEVKKEGSEFFPKLFRKVSVKKDQPYTLSFKIRRVKANDNVHLGMAVADAKEGWRSLGVHQQLVVGSAWKKVSVPFVAGDDSDKAQVQLTRFKTGSYELDDLSFKSGAESDFNTAVRLEDGNTPIVKSVSYAPMQARRDFYRFLVDTERAYWIGMSDYLKKDLKVKSVVSGTQLGYSPPQIQGELDYIDNHSYWCHPSPVAKDWRIRNESMVNSMGCIQGLANQRVAGKPYTVSEYNHPFPNQYGAEGQPMLRAYGRLQGWDGVFEYTYNHSPDFEPQRNTYFFSIIARTDVLAHFPACASIYLRGDVQEAKSSITGAMDNETYFNRLVSSKAVSAGIGAVGFDSKQTLIHKTAMDFSGKPGTDPASFSTPEGKVLVSDTGELTWNTEKAGAGYWTVNTPNTKLFTGFPEGRTINMGNVKLEIGKTRLNWATVSLVSRNATGFGESGKPASILLAATGLAENEGTVIDKITDKEIAFQDRLKWGNGTVLVEGIQATVTLPSDAAKTKCHALDQDGNRKKEVPVEKTEKGSTIILKPEYKTVWYEIEIN